MEEEFVNYCQIYDADTRKYLEEEFERLKDNFYLDHAGSTLYSKSQLKNVMDDLASSLYGNPHSLGTGSKLTLDIIDQIRFRILDHFHTTIDDYSIIFTSSATDSLKIISTAFRFSSLKNGHKSYGNFVYLEDNHTSVLGMREMALKNGAKVFCLGHEKAFDLFKTAQKKTPNPEIMSENFPNNSLFVYPAQCNFSGIKYPLDWIKKVAEYRALDYLVGDNLGDTNWFTLLDAASFVPTNDLNLTKYRPDFVCLSFYKIFGYPTGLGALLVKKSAEIVLEKIYYGGGTVDISLSDDTFHSKRSVLHERFEDGTLPFLSIISLRHGFDIVDKISLKKITTHVFSLAKYFHNTLISLHHANGSPLAILYEDTDYESEENQGGTVAFNLLRSNGENIGFVEFLNIANLHKIHVRTGCFCNPGSCKRHLKLSNDQLKRHFNSGHVCGDERDIIGGKPTGGIRISFGYMSKISEVEYLLDVIKKSFLRGEGMGRIPESWKNRQIKLREKFITNNSEGFDKCEKINSDKNYDSEMMSDAASTALENDVKKVGISRGIKSLKLKKLFIYPIKSCASFEIKDSWVIGDKGLAFDREWMIATASGTCLTQKQDIRLCLIKPIIKRSENIMELSYPGMPSIKIPLKLNPSEIENGKLLRSKICGHKVEGVDCGSDVSEWLSLTLGKPGLRLVRQNGMAKIKPQAVKKTPELSFSSQSQYLLINQSSIDWLADKIPQNSECDRNTILDRFRGNIIIDGGNEQPFAEMKWSKLKIGRMEFQVDGQCTRCQMICIDQNTGNKTIEPLRTLAEEFHGKMRFGIYLSSKKTGDNYLLKIGDDIFWE